MVHTSIYFQYQDKFRAHNLLSHFAVVPNHPIQHRMAINISFPSTYLRVDIWYTCALVIPF
jgi:hypothetical protein